MPTVVGIGIGIDVNDNEPGDRWPRDRLDELAATFGAGAVPVDFGLTDAQAVQGCAQVGDVVVFAHRSFTRLNTEIRTDNNDGQLFPTEPRAYLEDWAATDTAYLRQFYPPGHDEVHYELTPVFEKAYAWVTSLRVRAFVGPVCGAASKAVWGTGCGWSSSGSIGGGWKGSLSYADEFRRESPG